MKVLLLGGTGEARALAVQLTQRRISVVSSLAGRLDAPTLPKGQVRSGGFGGVEQLRRFVHESNFGAVVDATHPFAARMTANTVRALSESPVPLLRLQRPPWRADTGDRWMQVADLAAAASAVARGGDRVFLTIGRQGVAAFSHLDRWFLIRSIDQPVAALPRRHELLLARGPFTVQSETALLHDRRIDVLVSKNSGGEATSAKLDAARSLHIPVIMVNRPALPTGLSIVDSVDKALSWVEGIAEV